MGDERKTIEEEDEIKKTNIFWSECLMLVLLSPLSVQLYMHSHRQPLKENSW